MLGRAFVVAAAGAGRKERKDRALQRLVAKEQGRTDSCKVPWVGLDTDWERLMGYSDEIVGFARTGRLLPYFLPCATKFHIQIW